MTNQNSFFKTSHMLTWAVIVTATLAIYWNCLQHEFLFSWDDPEYVMNNPAVRGISLGNIKQAFTQFYVGNYSPIQIVSYMIDYSIWGLNPRGFIFTNMLLHACNGILVYQLLSRYFPKALPAFIGAMIFISHPVQVESVAWISQRKNVLSMLFFLLSYYSYLIYRDNPDFPLKKRADYLLSLLFFALAILVKSVAVILPAALFLHELCMSHPVKLRRQTYRLLLPYVALAAITAVLAYYSQSAVFGGGRITDFYGGSRWTTFITMATVYVHYLKLLLWPTDLSVIYTHAVKLNVDNDVVACGLLLLSIAGGAILLFKKQRQVTFWISLYFLGLLPVSQIIPISTLMNDRYLYYPMIGFAGLVGAIISMLQKNKLLRQWHLAIIMLLILPLPVLAYQRTAVWRSSITLWEDAVTRAPDSSTAYYGLGAAYYKSGQNDKALAAYLKQKQLDPASSNYELCLGLIYLKNEMYQNAIKYLREAMLLGNNSNQVKYCLAVALENSGKLDEAADMYSHVLSNDIDKEYLDESRQGLERVKARNQLKTSPRRNGYAPEQ